MELMKTTFLGSKGAKIQLLAIIIAVIVLAFVPKFSSAYLPLFLAWVLTYAVMSLAWTLFSGKTGYISLASAAFYGLGMYLQAVLGLNLPIVVTMAIGAAVCFGVAFGIGIITLRLRGVYFTIFTFALALFLNKFLHWFEVKFFHTKGRMVLAYDNVTVYYCVLVVFVIVLAVVLLMNKSRFGLALDCIGQNEDSAQHIGVNTTMTKVLAFAVSAAPVGAVGAAMATTIGYVDPDIAFKMLASFMPVLMAIFGGTHNTYGPILGAVVFYWLQDYLLRVTNMYQIIFGVVMVVVVLVMPKGIFGIIETVIARRGRSYKGEVIGDVQ
ncbi:MAG: branched-chain amino acid ABC transporter permease [Clostridiales Family XIII bacterium]|nr:branched-chain amino acid ABC transporter permease [Clostridiales Family XIII bacterium]